MGRDEPRIVLSSSAWAGLVGGTCSSPLLTVKVEGLAHGGTVARGRLTAKGAGPNVAASRSRAPVTVAVSKPVMLLLSAVYERVERVWVCKVQ